MKVRVRRNAALLEALLAVPGVTVAALQQAMYHLRIREGRCAKWRCRLPVEDGRTMCEVHRLKAIRATQKSKVLRREVREFLREGMAAE